MTKVSSDKTLEARIRSENAAQYVSGAAWFFGGIGFAAINVAIAGPILSASPVTVIAGFAVLAGMFKGTVDAGVVIDREMTVQKAEKTNRFRIAISSLLPGAQLIARHRDKEHRLYAHNHDRSTSYYL